VQKARWPAVKSHSEANKELLLGHMILRFFGPNINILFKKFQSSKNRGKAFSPECACLFTLLLQTLFCLGLFCLFQKPLVFVFEVQTTTNNKINTNKCVPVESNRESKITAENGKRPIIMTHCIAKTGETQWNK